MGMAPEKKFLDKIPDPKNVGKVMEDLIMK